MIFDFHHQNSELPASLKCARMQEYIPKSLVKCQCSRPHLKCPWCSYYLTVTWWQPYSDMDLGMAFNNFAKDVQFAVYQQSDTFYKIKCCRNQEMVFTYCFTLTVTFKATETNVHIWKISFIHNCITKNAKIVAMHYPLLKAWIGRNANIIF